MMKKRAAEMRNEKKTETCRIVCNNMTKITIDPEGF